MNPDRWKVRLQPKLILGLVVMAMVLLLSLTLVVTTMYRRRMEEYFSKIAFDQASVAAEIIDGDAVRRYYETGKKDAYYHEIHEYLLMVKQKVGLKYFYVVVPEEDVMVYIWDSGVEGEEGVCDLLDEDTYYGGGHRLMHEAFAVDADRKILVTRNAEYGYLASAYVAILDSAGVPVALASVDISMEIINQQLLTFVGGAVLVSCLILIISAVAYYYYVRHIVIRPAVILHDAAGKLVKDEMDDLGNFTIDIHSGDEFEDLAQAFQYMTVELSEYIKNLTEVTAEKERIGAELDVAAQIQSSMLPCIFPAFPGKKEIDIYATMNPAKEVGGDFYDFFMVDDRHLAVVMADVSGKGVPAALFMVIGKTLIKDHTQPGKPLGEVFSDVNNLLCDSNSEGLFITAFEGVLDLETGEFFYVNAGHEVPYINRAGEGYQPYKVRPGFVLAGMEDMRYKEGSLILQPGDRIFLYTDGVPEATNRENELYGNERLYRILNQNKDRTPKELLPEIKADVDLFVGEAPQFDDITMLCLEYKGKTECGI
ncbi:MAG: SpoIIE family protein phosphatase [Hungatella sp.]|nr:SpoIIE family protein phosphatase [Hungatella sp.]